MKEKSFCSVDNFSVMIPYRDLQKLMEAAYNCDALQKKLDDYGRQLTSLRLMYSEALAKIAEISKFL